MQIPNKCPITLKKIAKVEFESTRNLFTIIAHGQEETWLSIHQTLNECQIYSKHHAHTGDDVSFPFWRSSAYTLKGKKKHA